MKSRAGMFIWRLRSTDADASAFLGYKAAPESPHDQVQARIAAAVAAGGHIVSDANAPGWWTLADPEGNEVDLAIWGLD